MKIAVIGGGIFGVTAAIVLSTKFEVDLFEKHNDILMAGSDVHQCRIHRGYHYPRSTETVSSVLKSQKSFYDFFSSAIMHDIEPYYCISKRGSLTSAKEYLDFCKRSGLEYEKSTIAPIDNSKIDLCVKVNENLFDHSKLKKICWNKLQQSQVNINLNNTVNEQIFENYDQIVISTYADLNKLLSHYPGHQLNYQFEVCEKVFVKLPHLFQNKSILIMDGPFMSIDPVGSTDYFIIGDVVNTVHQRNIGKFPEIDEKYIGLLNKGILSNPPISNYNKFINSASEFMPEIKNAEYVGSSFCIKTVLANVDKTDERPTLIRQVTPNITIIFSGKIPTCIETAHEVLRNLTNTS